MNNGFIVKYKAHASRLNDADLANLAAHMEEHGYDANEAQWEQLNSAVDALPTETPDDKANREAASAGTGARIPVPTPMLDGKPIDRYVSQSPPGSPDNPIGWPGTDQDQDAPGTGPRTVPGQKVTKPDAKR